MRKRQKISAWLLLSVFLTMQLLLSVHQHELVETVKTTCVDCLHHRVHSGHFGTATKPMHECLICQLAEVPFTAGETLTAPELPELAAPIIAERQANLPQRLLCHLNSRAPPTNIL